MLRFSWSFLVLTLLLSIVSGGCAYRYGNTERMIPGGYKQVAVPIFKNRTQETSIEVFFTNSMIRQIERSKFARVTAKEDAEVIILGEVDEIKYVPRNINEHPCDRSSLESRCLPSKVFITDEYQITVTVSMVVKRKSDLKVLWEGKVSGESVYSAPKIYSYGYNSANPIYNLSARRQNVEAMADDMMGEAHDRMTENF